jgi:ubiquinol-cytochrome c reductase iron-sulfur subunit
MSEATPRGAPTVAVVCFVVAMLAALGLAVAYAVGSQPQLEGALLGTSLVGIGVGCVVWAHALLPHGPFEQPREPLASTAGERAAFEEDLGREGVVTRRRLLVGSLLGALGALGVALLFPIRSLGPSPGNTLRRTPWRAGVRAVTDDGEPVRAAAVPMGGLVTVFPDGHPGSADGQVVLVRIPARDVDLPAGRRDWSVGGLLAYSKVCTHAGCPVGLFEAEQATLLCPCHQSAFDVRTGATPVFGPAARALPQLPIEIDDDGFVVAQWDFHEPIGPTYWNRA